MHFRPFRPAILSFAVALALGSMGACVPALAANSAALQAHGRVEMPQEYTGDFDHFAADVKGNRLFLAAEDHGTLEVFELSSGKHLKTISGFEAPHNILYLPDRERLVVLDSGAGLSKILDARTYKITDTLKLAPGADSMAYDPDSGMLYAVTGGKNGNFRTTWVAKVNPRTGQHLADLRFETDKVEAMAIEKKGPHMYVNVTGKNQVAVIDKHSFQVIKTWPISGAEMPAPMALDEKNHRLFVVTRKPFTLQVLDTESGRTIASFDAPNRTNEIMFDRDSRRIYLAGDNFISVFQQQDADRYEELPHVTTAVGAKTAILVPELKRMYVALSPGEGKTGAAVLSYDVVPVARH